MVNKKGINLGKVEMRGEDGKPIAESILDLVYATALKHKIEKSLDKKVNEKVIKENFVVNTVISESYINSSTPNLILEVSPENKNIPVTTLRFQGYSIVKVGDYISALISLYKLSFRDKYYYKKRDLKLEEEIIEITVLSEDREKELRTDRSIIYNIITNK